VAEFAEVRTLAERGRTLAERGQALAAALDAGQGRLPDELVGQGRTVLRHATQRGGLSAEHTVAALAGATGTGKSSLFNALAGADIAAVGVRRPTTIDVVAAVWGAGADPLLDWLDVSDRHHLDRAAVEPVEAGPGRAWLRRFVAARVAGGPPDGLPGGTAGLVLLDLPDVDSVVAAHRLRADRLVQRADLLVWVVDPQKYADAALHTRYLRPWAGHESVTVLVLNQADRLDAAATDAVLADLRRLAAADGLRDVRTLAVSAVTGAGVDELRRVLAGAAARRRAATDRWAADERAIARSVLAACGDGVPKVAAAAAEPLIAAFEQVAGVDVVTEAVRRSAVRRAGAHTGWPPVRWLARLRPDPLRRFHLGVSTGAGAGSPGKSSFGGGSLGTASSGAGSPGTAAMSRASSGAGSPGADSPTVPDRTSLPPAHPAARAGVGVALRDLLDRALAGAPEAWQLAARARVTGDGLADDLDRAVAATPLLLERPARWWRAVGWVQWLLLAVVVAGLVWLGAYWLVGSPPRGPRWGALPVPTWLAAGGVLAGWAVAGLGRIAGHLGARRRARAARQRLRSAVLDVARRRVLHPVAAELAALDTCRRAAARAAR